MVFACAPVHKARIINTVFASLRLRVLRATRSGEGGEGGGSGRLHIDPSALSVVPARREEVALRLLRPWSSNLRPLPPFTSQLQFFSLLLSPFSDRTRSNMSRFYYLFCTFNFYSHEIKKIKNVKLCSFRLEGSLKS